MKSRFEPEPVSQDEVFGHCYYYGMDYEKASEYERKKQFMAAFSRLRSEGTLEDKVEFLLDRLEESL